MKKPQLTLEEKFRLLRGKNYWNIDDLDGKLPVVTFSDGPHGLRRIDEETKRTIPSTAYPNAVTIANTWNVALARQTGESIADACIEQKTDVLLAPGVNIKRSPLCGRNFEYYSEDPYLAGEMGYAFIDGVQSKGIGTSLKHFAANNNENYRHMQNSEVEERALHEIYLSAFERALEAKPWTVMCSYNKINGAYANENPKLLKGILRGQFGYDGLIISDWNAVKNRARALKATLDLEMPFNENSVQDLEEAYQAGFISEEEVDACVERIFALIDKVEKAAPLRKVTTTKEQRHENAVKIAEEGFVLLKNEGGVLPLKAGAKIDLYNPQGSLQTMGGGSSLAVTDYKVKGLDETLREAGYFVEGFNDCGTGYYNLDATGDYQLVVVNTQCKEIEAVDRDNMLLKTVDEESLINLAERNENVIALVYAGSAVDTSRWAHKVKAIVFVGFGGEGTNEALANVLSGKVSPSGKLAETFPTTAKDCPVDKSEEFKPYNYYAERFNVGYRYYDKYATPAFAFGHGLSYAKFEYSDLALEKKGGTDYVVSYTVTNVSSVAGKEVSEVYVSDLFSTSERPEKELKGFSKDLLMPGESKRISIPLDKKAFAFWNPALGGWYVENGKFRILVGAASDDIRLSAEITVNLPKFTQFSPVHSRKY